MIPGTIQTLKTLTPSLWLGSPRWSRGESTPHDINRARWPARWSVGTRDHFDVFSQKICPIWKKGCHFIIFYEVVGPQTSLLCATVGIYGRPTLVHNDLCDQQYDHWSSVFVRFLVERTLLSVEAQHSLPWLLVTAPLRLHNSYDIDVRHATTYDPWSKCVAGYLSRNPSTSLITTAVVISWSRAVLHAPTTRPSLTNNHFVRSCCQRYNRQTKASIKAIIFSSDPLLCVRLFHTVVTSNSNKVSYETEWG